MRTTRLAALAAVLAASVLMIAPTSYAAAQSTAPEPTTTAPPRVVKRSVLPDGMVQLEMSDGTTRRASAAAAAPTPSSESSSTADETQLEPTAPPAWLKDPATNQAFLRAMGEYYEYRASGLQHRRRVFEWQLVSSKIIFVVVLLLVGSGIVFAAIQFRMGLRRKKPDERDAATSLDVSTTGVKVSSPVLGVIILVISLAFFYLYLVYVYPISELV